EFNHAGIIEIRAGHVNQLASLLLDSSDNFGMAMAGSNDSDAGGEIEESVAINVFHGGAPAELRDHRIIAGIGRRDYAMVTLDGFLGLGAGQFRSEERRVGKE